MVTGAHGCHGHHAVCHVVVVYAPDRDCVTLPFHSLAAPSALVVIGSGIIVTTTPAQVTA